MCVCVCLCVCPSIRVHVQCDDAQAIRLVEDWSPFLVATKPSNVTALKRQSLVRMLYDHIHSHSGLSDAIHIVLGAEVANVDEPSSECVRVIYRDTQSSGKEKMIDADLVIGCDGVNSKVVESMKRLDKTFQIHCLSNISSLAGVNDVRYKMLCLPSDLTVDYQPSSQPGPREKLRFLPSTVVILLSALRNRKLPFRLTSFGGPANQERVVLVLCTKDHPILVAKTGEEVLRCLEGNLPFVRNLREIVPMAEAELFAKRKIGRFSLPRYASTCHHGSRVLLMGDAIHSFPAVSRQTDSACGHTDVRACVCVCV